MPIATQQPLLLSPVTTEDLGELKVGLPSLKVISHRGPGDGGGVPASLEALVAQLGTKVQWIAVTGLPSAESQPPGFTFHKPDIPEALVTASARASAGYLWPLFHGLPERATFDPAAWRSFRQLSEVLATQTLRLASESFPTLCWLHDFHMALVAPYLSIETGTITCHFWHIPWPSPAVILDCPVARELVEPLLSNRLVGFHTSEYATNFLATVQELFPDARVDQLNMEVRWRGRLTRVAVMPLGLDFAYWQRLAETNRARAAAIPKKHRLANQFILGVDRLDYSKGLMEKLDGLGTFLSSYPEWHRRFHYVQLAQRPLTVTGHLKIYADLVKARVDELNRQFHKDGWQPVIWLEGELAQPELAAWYQAADVLAVTPVRDGLNLIAKEYVACRQDEQGAVVLSRRAGCAGELSTGAILIDPDDQEQIASALAQALSMSFEEKRRRMHSMRHIVGWNQIHDWACGFLRQAVGSGAVTT